MSSDASRSKANIGLGTGYMPADFDRLIEISGESGGTVEIDEDMLLEAMPDFTQFLPGLRNKERRATAPAG